MTTPIEELSNTQEEQDVKLPSVKAPTEEFSAYLENSGGTKLGGIFSSPEVFTGALQMAAALSNASFLPREYQGKDGRGNLLIALDVAARTGLPPMAVAQNLYVINGRPSWSSQFIISVINNSRRYDTPIQFEMSGEGDQRSCVAWVVDQQGNKLEGTKITIQMAKEEGWYSKSGSKWKTMPDQMLKYRAASFFGRAYCPDLIMGVYTEDENRDLSQAPVNMIAPDPLAEG